MERQGLLVTGVLMRHGNPHIHYQKGYTLIGVLLLLALCMLSLSLAGPIWAARLKREREQELLRIGALYAKALQSYRDMSPGSHKQYPKNLRELLLDPRIPGVNRHIRTLYVDPLNPERPWGLVLDQEGRIEGVYSQNQEAPMARDAQRIGRATLSPAQKYSDWQFKAQN